MTIPTTLNDFLFNIFPYICVVVWLLGSFVRFDREPYTWKTDSSQVLQKRELWWGSNFFHYGVGIVLIGHIVGFLTPESLVLSVITPEQHQLLAMVTGGIAGVFAIIGMSILIHRRLFYPRIRANSRRWDIAVVVMLWLQLALGLITEPYSAAALGTPHFEQIVRYVQDIAYFQGGGAQLLQGMPWVFHIHILLGFSILLISPFTRLVHIWSGVGTLAYLVRPHQLVRKRGSFLR